jgi:hypothetical protein
MRRPKANPIERADDKEKAQPPLTEEEISDYQRALTEEVKTWLVSIRGLSEEVIQSRKLGYGEFYGRHWLTIPIKSERGWLLKLHRLPTDPNNPNKNMWYPKGGQVLLYGSEILNEKIEYVVVCEGELDKLVLESKGVNAVTSTAGAGTFPEEWVEKFSDVREIIVCYDNDEQGRKGSQRVLGIFKADREDLELYQIELPNEVGDKGDITDFFMTLKGTVDEFLLLKQPYQSDSVKTERFAELLAPKSPILMEDAQAVIHNNFPDYLFAWKVGLSAIAQILIDDVTNPFALILVDVPSAGKTITINFFDGIKKLTYASDKFSPASFVSHASNVKKEKLEEIDLLPRLRYKMFLIRDFGSIFSQREEDLQQSLGILTRVLDGEGFQSDTGVHGSRGYRGEYLFMILGGSTPISSRVWKMMGNLGSRLFFLNLNSPDKSEEQLAAQLKDRSYKVKERECQRITNDFLHTLWATYPKGVQWEKSSENFEFLKIVSRCAKMLASLRGVINVYQEKGFDGGEISFSTPVVEKPDRLNQLLYNLARGHALVHGRRSISEEDLKVVIEVSLDSAELGRSKLFQLLIENGGVLTTQQIEKCLNCSKPTASKSMKALCILGLCEELEADELQMGRPPNRIKIASDFSWFLSEEFKRIRGIQ